MNDPHFLEKLQLALSLEREIISSSDVPSTETTPSEGPGPTPTDDLEECPCDDCQLDFADYDPEWADQLEKKYGIAKPID